jgi:uncharacterized protein (DUF1330 family)
MNKSTINPTEEQEKYFLDNLPDDQPIVMLNLLKFKEKVEGTDLTGEQGYDEYGRHFMPHAIKAGAKLLWVGKPLMYFIGSESDVQWDKVLIVEYPSKKHFFEMVTAPDYHADLRTRSLENSKLIPSLSIYNILNVKK